MNDIFSQIALWVEYIGMIIIAISAVVALFNVVFNFKDLKQIRRKFGERILTGLEFIIAGELIIVTILPDFTDLLDIAVIVAIRAVLGFILKKEIA